jgi:diguanylate cyclase (GGDEF)-like protein
MVVVPLIASTWSAWLLVSAARTEAHHAARIEAAVPTVDALLQTAQALRVEGTSAGVAAYTRYLSPATVKLIESYGVSAHVDTTEANVNRKVADLEASLPSFTAKLRGDIAVIRRNAALPSATEQSVGVDYLRVVDELVAEFTQRDATLISQAQHLQAGANVVNVLTALNNAGLALHYRTSMFGDVATVFLSPGTTHVSAIATLAKDDGLYQVQSHLLTGSSTAAVADKWRSYIQDPRMQRFDAIATGYLNGQHASNAAQYLQQEQVIAKTVNFVDTSFDGVFQQIDRSLTQDAQVIQDQSATTERETTIALSVMVVLLAGLAIFVSRWIGNPLKDLSRRARAVTDGRLEVAAAPAKGPREIRQVAAAFNDLVGNLRLLEAKTLAVANIDLGSAVVTEPLPGRLGTAIDTSMRVLAASVADRARLSKELTHRAMHDLLTGLPNRAFAVTVIESALARGLRAGTPVAVLFVDLDGFKLVNDTHGHKAGDSLLVEVAARMRACARNGELVARLGGDEFLLVAEDTNVQGAVILAERLIETTSRPAQIEGNQLSVGASVGIAMVLDGNVTAEEILVRADLALYRAKGNGRGRLELFDESLQQAQEHQRDVEAALRATLERGGDELVLHYQPVISGATGQLEGMEALVRWHRPGFGQVYPDDFIPIAEKSALIIELDQWVLATTAAQGRAWLDQKAMSDLTLAVNISGRHLLSGRLPGNLRDALATSGLPPRNLILEITETVLITDLPTVSVQLSDIRELGVLVAVDDFGTGFTSVAALRSLPVDIIKVDRSFVNGIEEGSNHALVAMVTRLGHELGATVIAEGVETQAQLAALTALAVDQVQGYLFSRPVSGIDFAQKFLFLTASRPAGVQRAGLNIRNEP